MSDRTKIEWCDSTWNPITGCSPVSIGCEHCYAARIAKRFPDIHDPHFDFRLTIFHPNRLEIPYHWKKPRKIFVCSMGDLFHPDVTSENLQDILQVISDCQQHTFMVLTKRPENIMEKIYAGNLLGGGDYLRNLWIGVSVENQKSADERIPILLQIPASVRFISVEPMLGPVDLLWGLEHPLRTALSKLDWVICGRETGVGARPINLDWVRSLRDQCVTSGIYWDAPGVPFFYKNGLLDGKERHQYPEGEK